MGQLATCLGNRAAILILLKLPHRALDDIDRAIVLRRELLVNTLEDELRDSKLVEKFANNESRFGGHIRNSMAKSFADFSLRFGEVADDQLAWLYLVRGNCLATVDQFSLAIASYGAAFDMYTNCFKNQGETHYMLSIGTVLAQRSISSFELHDNQRALKDSNRSIKIFRGLISSDGRPSVNSQLATALFLRSIIRTGTNAHQEAVADLTKAELTFRQLINSEGQKQYVDTHKKVN